MYSNRDNSNGPPCETCQILPADSNREPVFLFPLVQWQTVTTEINEKRVVDLNLQAVKTVMDIYKIKDQEACLRKLVTLFHFMMGKR